tara:strand:- start:241 stop:1239 length:999 start_codon:yes stop_codon:yes gene_type:complete
MIETVNIDDIMIRLFDEDQVINPFKIENTPHYKLLCGDRTEYDIYYDRMHRFGRAKNHYMNADQYIEFFPTFKYLQPPFSKEYISVKKVGSRYESLDGDHRLASLKRLGEQFIQVDVQDAKFKHEGYSNIIDIAKTLEGLDDYVVLKGHDYFPNYYNYDDLDILCKDKQNLFDDIHSIVNKTHSDCTIKTKDKNVRIHIDIIPPGFDKLNFRFDLLDMFPYDITLNHQTTHIQVSREYFNMIFNRKVKRGITPSTAFDQDSIQVWFPSEVDDLVLRFLEWVWQPHKTRHIQAVRDKFNHSDEFIDIINKHTNIDIDNKYIQDLFQDLKTKGI